MVFRKSFSQRTKDFMFNRHSSTTDKSANTIQATRNQILDSGIIIFAILAIPGL